jgi:hypothetical protein
MEFTIGLESKTDNLVALVDINKVEALLEYTPDTTVETMNVVPMIKHPAFVTAEAPPNDVSQRKSGHSIGRKLP